MNYDSFHSKVRIQERIISSTNFTYRNIINELSQVICGKKLSILDFGCGVGVIDLFLASKGHIVTGYDISRKAIKIANESAHSLNLKKRLRFLELSKFNKEVKKGMYDLVVCTEVIEHLENDTVVVKKLIGLLKKGGILFITTPSINAPLFKLGLTKKFDDSVGHLRRYEPKKLEELIESSGMKVVNIRRTEGIIRNSLFIISPLGKLIRLIRGPISDIVTFLDNISVRLFGESDIMILAKKS